MIEKVVRSLNLDITIARVAVGKCLRGVKGSKVESCPVLPLKKKLRKANTSSAKAAVQRVEQTKLSAAIIDFFNITQMVRNSGVMMVNFRVTANGRGVGKESKGKD